MDIKDIKDYDDLSGLECQELIVEILASKESPMYKFAIIKALMNVWGRELVENDKIRIPIKSRVWSLDKGMQNEYV